MLRKRSFALLAAVTLTCGMAGAQPPAFTYAAVDYPNSKLSNAQGINARGDIVGAYTSQDNKVHGFLLHAGEFTTIDYPGATITWARGINSQGDIVGTHQGPNFATPGSGGDIHGFLLRAGASVPESVDYPGHMNTIAQRITEAGQIFGCYHDHDTMGSMHGMMASDGSFVALDGTENALDVFASMNNGATPDGSVITGLYTDMTLGKTRSYIISSGTFTPFDYPGAKVTTAWDMNPSGQIVGNYVDASSHTHGFLLSHGQFYSIDYPAAGVRSTQAIGINPQGDVVGWYVDSAGATHGYLLTHTRPVVR